MDSDAALLAIAAVAAAPVQPGHGFHGPASGHAIGRAAQQGRVCRQRLTRCGSHCQAGCRSCLTMSPYNSAMSLSRAIFAAVVLGCGLTATHADTPAVPTVTTIP